jgi:type II secretory ATPase GspE/PulE/Tfp pilus assembly ATPase PilB-like protein
MNSDPARGAAFQIRSRSEINARLAEALRKEGFVDEDRLAELQHRSTWVEVPLEKLMLREGLISEEMLLNVLARITGVPVLNMARIRIERQALETMSAKSVTEYNIIPVGMQSGTVTVATDHVWDITEEDHLRVILGYNIAWVFAPAQEIRECIKHYYGVGIETFLRLGAGEREEPSAAQGREGVGRDIPSFVHAVIRDAIQVDATDIHIEPTERSLRLRYRIDGVLQEFPLPAGIEEYVKPIISSVKIMAQMDIAEHRKPQDGRFSIHLAPETFDIRASALPMAYGETLNLRILNREATLLDIHNLGLEDREQQQLERLIALPYGMALFTGPTGSGKTTSLYAALDALNSDERKIITLEDPIEYRIEGITQLQMESRIGFTFASGLRSVLRHDPDVVLVGEIRDAETADIAISAALTGHLVFSTLHTNDAPGALTRLVDMNVEPYLVASALEGVIAQRLLRSICPHCREAEELDDSLFAELRSMFPSVDAKPEIYRGTGCPYCRFTGYHGREPIFEILEMDDTLRALTTHHASTTDLQRAAIRNGLMTLRRKGWRKVLAGRTTIEELLRVTRSAQAMRGAPGAQATGGLPLFEPGREDKSGGTG